MAVALVVALSGCGGGDSDRVAELERQIADLEARLATTEPPAADTAAEPTVAPTQGSQAATSTHAPTPPPTSARLQPPPSTTTSSSTSTTSSTTTTTTTTTTPPAADLRFAWAHMEEGGWGFSTYSGTTSYTGHCHVCEPAGSSLVENHDFRIDIYAIDVVSNELIVSRGRVQTAPYAEVIHIELGPSYSQIPQLTLTEDHLRLEPSQRYPFALDFTKSVDQYGQTIIQGSAIWYELLADGTLRVLNDYHVFTVALREEG